MSFEIKPGCVNCHILIACQRREDKIWELAYRALESSGLLEDLDGAGRLYDEALKGTEGSESERELFSAELEKRYGKAASKVLDVLDIVRAERVRNNQGVRELQENCMGAEDEGRSDTKINCGSPQLIAIVSKIIGDEDQ